MADETLEQQWREYMTGELGFQNLGDRYGEDILNVPLPHSTTANDWIEQGLTPNDYKAWIKGGGCRWIVCEEISGCS